MKYLVPIFGFTLLLTIINAAPARAGDPDETIGPPNPNLHFCVDRKGNVIDLTSDAAVDGFFDPTIEVDLDELEKECEDLDSELGTKVELLRQTRIEGFVFEFHPDPNGPGGWTAVPARDVLVVATGISFEIFWASEKDGSYFFDGLGAGPITLNLRLPPDAHSLNPNVAVQSTSLAQTWQIPLGFYRGDTPPADFDALALPPGFAFSVLPPPDTIFEEFGDLTPMPNVGGVLPQDQPISTAVLATVVLVVLPAAGILRLRRNRPES